jgi:hypothetical protein
VRDIRVCAKYVCADWAGFSKQRAKMQAPVFANKRFLIFTGQLAICMHHENYATFSEAWNALSKIVQGMKELGATLTMMHASAEWCMSANPEGAGGNSFQKEWPACTRASSGDAELRRVMGDGRIVMIQWN